MWIVDDPCGKNYAMAAHALLLVVDLLFCLGVIWPLGASWHWALLHQVSYALSAVSHLSCMLTDPGAVPIEMGSLREEAESSLAGHDRTEELGSSGNVLRWCKHCKVAKPPRAHHCSTCQRCILKMDHHCMWMNNCVGAYNQKHFLLFLAYVSFHCGGTALAVVIMLLQEASAFVLPSWHKNVARMSRANTAAAVAVLIFASCFGRYALTLLREQAQALRLNRTGIELLQDSCGEPRALWSTLEEVMGDRLSWRWLLPVPVRRGSG
eukprot:TRINITY_DN76222_c0_g1_i1.p1 TRINITY_DN76222_c0_g1~~TRINITY_DN76222_c0_g1_i1.p1  ORF type:complete len:266 (+),score=36.14 TRINITY_DN76222_c0_g1_i1:61-858(+)